jgi:hypothetical protein
MRRGIIAFVVLAAAIAIMAGGALAAAHKKIPHTSCASMVSQGTIVSDIGAGATVKLLPVSHGPFYDFLRHRITGTGCEENWVNPNETTPPVGDPDPQSGISPGYWRVLWNYKLKAWNAWRSHEASDPVECSGSCTETQTPLALGHGSQGFVETVTLQTAGNPPPVYYLYVYSKQHNFFSIFLWPVSLANLSSIAENLLAQKPPAF